MTVDFASFQNQLDSPNVLGSSLEKWVLFSRKLFFAYKAKQLGQTSEDQSENSAQYVAFVG